MLDWDYKSLPAPRLWSAKADYEDVLEIGGNAVTVAMKQSTRHLIQPRPTLLATDSASASMSAEMSGSGQNGLANGTLTAVDSRDGTPALEVKPNAAAQADLTRASSPALSVSGKGLAAQSKAVTPLQAEATGSGIDYLAESSKLPLDVAVFESICQSGAEDKVKRVATNILIVGGVGNLQGIGWALQSRCACLLVRLSILTDFIVCRLEPLMRQRFPAGPAPLVIPRSKYADPAHMAWKGIQNLCRLDVVQDLWIRQDDWHL